MSRVRPGATRRRARGMTMIEVMIATAIITMMMVAVWASISNTMRGMRAMQEQQEQAQIIRTSLGRLTAELSMAYLSFNRPPDEPRHFTLFDGRDNFERDSVTFTALAHLRMRKDANESDQSIIQYFVADDPEDSSRSHLYRRESRRLTGDLPEKLEDYFPAYVVCEDVEVFDVHYWDPIKQEWLTEWATTVNDAQPDRLPPRVKIRLGVKERGEVVFYAAQTELFMQEKIDLGRE